MITVFETRDREVLRDRLARDPVASAYLLGDLDPRFFDDARFLVAEGGAEAVVLVYTGLSVPALLAVGDADGVRAILEDPKAKVPRRFDAHLLPAHRGAFEAGRALSGVRPMVRMRLGEAKAAPASGGLEVRRLGPEDAGALLPVYADYPGHHYEPGQLDRGVYVGGFAGGRLVSVAGTHVHAPEEGVCALGNIVTARDARGRGHATAVVARLVSEVRGTCPVVVLNVREDNAPARACYRRVGFEDAFGYLEAVAEGR